MIVKIESLVSADGWWAGYIEDNGEKSFLPLAVFASIVERDNAADEDNSLVVGMDASDLAAGGHASESSNFRGYYHETEFSKVGLELVSRANARFEAGGY